MLLCGSGTTGCHGWAHANPARAKRDGLIVPSWATAAFCPVLTVWGWRIQNVDGTVEHLTAEAAIALQHELGLR